jgi:hypothetical protein
MSRGEADPGAWDYFVSCRIRDVRLEEIRNEVVAMETLGSPYMEGRGANAFELNDKGLRRLTELAEECSHFA